MSLPYRIVCFAVVLCACSGPTLYVGTVTDKGGVTSPDASSMVDAGDTEPDSDDDLPCTDQSECEGNGSEVYCDLENSKCEECLRDDHCRRGEHCEDGDCED